MYLNIENKRAPRVTCFVRDILLYIGLTGVLQNLGIPDTGEPAQNGRYFSREDSFEKKARCAVQTTRPFPDR